MQFLSMWYMWLVNNTYHQMSPSCSFLFSAIRLLNFNPFYGIPITDALTSLMLDWRPMFVFTYIGKQDTQSLFHSTQLMNHLPPMTLNCCWPKRRGDAVCFIVALGEAFLSTEANAAVSNNGWRKRSICKRKRHNSHLQVLTSIKGRN